MVIRIPLWKPGRPAPSLDSFLPARSLAGTGSLSDQAYQILRDAILDLDLPPGEQLRKAELCDALNMSRSPLASALTRLENEGLVEIQPQSGTRVTRLSMARLREADFIRKQIDLAATRHLAQKMTRKQLNTLEDIFERQREAARLGERRDFFIEDEVFHAFIQRSTGHVNLPDILNRLTMHLNRARKMLLPNSGRMAETLGEHRAILEGLKAGNADQAADAMEAHLDLLMTYIAPLEHQYPEIFEP